MSSSSHSCQRPLQYYTCDSNDFKGCCSVDACNSLGCPDSDMQSVAAVSSSAASSSSPKPSPSSSSPALHSLAASSIFSAFADPDPTSLALNPYEAATLLIPRPAIPSTSADDASTVLITSVVFVSQRIVTPTSNGIALLPTSSMITSTVLSSLSTPKAALSAQPLSTSSTTLPLSSASATPTATKQSPPTKAAIAGSVGGVAGVLVAVLLIWLLTHRQRSRREKEIKKMQLDDDPRLQGIDAHRAGSAFKEGDGPPPYGMGADAAGTGHHVESRSSLISPLSPTNHASASAISTRPSPPYDRTSPGTEGLIFGSGNPHSELFGEPAPSISELSPVPERSVINTPNRAGVVPPEPTANATGKPQDKERLIMHSNLDSMVTPPKSEGVEAGKSKHVMSWMDYDAASPGPAR